MTADAIVSPRGVPPIRTDWLADIALRLAALGPDHLRTLGAERLVTTDVIDGAHWEISPILFCPPDASAVELDGDLIRTDDPATADLRIGVAIRPAFDERGARVQQVRIEIGPRGAVTFDPENWMFAFPLEQLASGARPPVAGLQAGEFVPSGTRRPTTTPGTLADLAGMGAIDLTDLAQLADLPGGTRLWQLVLGVLAAPPRRRFFGLAAPAPAQPFATLTLTADGPLTISPTEAFAVISPEPVQPAARAFVETGRLIVETGDAIPGGQLIFAGPGLAVQVHRIADW